MRTGRALGGGAFFSVSILRRSIKFALPNWECFSIDGFKDPGGFELPNFLCTAAIVALSVPVLLFLTLK